MSPLEILQNEEIIRTLLMGGGLVLLVLGFGWLEYRRTSRLPNLGTVMVKNRLKSSS